MHVSVRRANDERRLDPAAFPHGSGAVGGPRHPHQSHERRLALSKAHWTTPHDDESRVARRLLHTAALLFRKYTRKESARLEMLGRHTCVVGDVAAQLETAGHLLR